MSVAQRVHPTEGIDMKAPCLADAPSVETEDEPLCPVCGHDHFSACAEGYDYELCTCRNRWRFVACGKCGHVWLNPRPGVNALAVIYPKTYYAYDYEGRINPIARFGKELLDALKLRGILRALGHLPEAFLDIGCGSGRFLRAMKRRGLSSDRIFGLELDAAVTRRLSQEGFRAHCERVETAASIPDTTMELVTMFHVVEHVASPTTVVGNIVRWLKPGGILAIETPNLESIDARLFRKRFWGGYHIPRHWNLFTPRSLERLLVDQGLELERLSFQTGHSFWMYSLHHLLRYGPVPFGRLASAFDPLKGLPFLIGFTAFDRLRAMLGFRTSSMLMIARKPVRRSVSMAA